MAVKVLWKTSVGSHLWGMNHEGSDIDVYEAVQVPTRHLLLGRGIPRFANRVDSSDTMKYDIQTHEIGRVVEQVLDGNVNHLWGVFSPIVLTTDNDSRDLLASLRRISERNFSKRCYGSLQGLARKNVEKYIATGKDTSVKRLNIIARTVQMGITLLMEGRIEFKATSVTTPEEVSVLILKMKIAHELSRLPDDPPEPHLLEDWLLSVREMDWVDWDEPDTSK